MPFRADATCPDCREPLVAYRLEGIELDGCPGCRGTWLDAGELELMAEIAGVGPGSLTEALESATGGARGRRRCPRCWRRLEAVSVGEKPPVDVDRCRIGHGLWLDAGETEALIRGHADGEEELVARFFADLYGKSLDSGTDR
jgi:Zn-finger nucleic acid-binding protein